MKFRRSLFIFRRDLRLEDNTGLIKALESSEDVVACFILDPRQKNNDYFSSNAFEFMLRSLQELHDTLRSKDSQLYVFSGQAHDVVSRLIEENGIEGVYVNTDYTPFSKKRDDLIRQVCTKHKVFFSTSHDYLLTDPDFVKTKAETLYTVFTPYWKNARRQTVPEPRENTYTNYAQGNMKGSDISLLEIKEPNPNLHVKGGRKEAKELLCAAKDIKYKETKDQPWKSTTDLSAHNKFGMVSIREVYHAFANEKNGSALQRQLYWRDFFTYIAYHFPYVFEGAFRKKYNKLAWENDEKKFEAWRRGKTGFPIVDAGMRQLNATGYMHNRVRMIAASFLVKDLLIDWRWGERYFAQLLVDYDPSVNNGNWQWAASTGCDAQPYFRIFNPWTQQKKYDADTRYIKRWVQELQDVDASAIHDEKRKIEGYPSPIIHHKKAREKALALFRT